MILKTKSGGNGDGSYEKPKPGNYFGVLIGFAEIGTQETNFGDKKQVMLRWELHKRKGPSADSQGNIHTITAKYTASLHEKAALRGVVEAHVGKLPDNSDFDTCNMIGSCARLTLTESDDGKYVNVNKAMAPLDLEEDPTPVQVLDAEHWEIETHSPCPSWASYMFDKSKEGMDLKKDKPGLGSPIKPGSPLASAADSDDIPF